MMTLIAEEFKPQDKLETSGFEINLKVEDIKVIQREIKVDKVKKFVTPPPPTFERSKADKPTQAMTTIGGVIPEFITPKIDKTPLKIAVSDRDAQPLARIPPIMPTRAENLAIAAFALI